MNRLAGLFVVGICGNTTNAGAREETAQAASTAGTALRASDVAVAIDKHIDGIDRGLIHGGEVSVFHQDNGNGAWMLVEVFPDSLFGFADMYGKNNQGFAGKFLGDLVDEAGFLGAIAAPGGPELEEHDLAFDGFVGEFFAASGGSVKPRGGFFAASVGSGVESDRRCGKQQ